MAVMIETASDLASLIRGGDFQKLREQLVERRPPELAAALSELRADDQVIAFRILPRGLAAAVFEYMPPESQYSLLKAMGQEDVAALLNRMAPDDRTSLLSELPANATKRLLELLTPEERREAVTLLGYAPGTVGRLMTPHYIAIREDWTVQQVLDYVRAHGQNSETLNVIYVVDEAGVLIDDIRIREFLVVPLTTRVSDLMDRRFVTLEATDTQESAVAVFRREDRSALPVTDTAGVLIGIVTVDDVLDVAEEAATRDFQMVGGSEALDEPYMQISPLGMVKKRAGWLVVLFLGDAHGDGHGVLREGDRSRRGPRPVRAAHHLERRQLRLSSLDARDSGAGHRRAQARRHLARDPPGVVFGTGAGVHPGRDRLPADLDLVGVLQHLRTALGAGGIDRCARFGGRRSLGHLGRFGSALCAQEARLRSRDLICPICRDACRRHGVDYLFFSRGGHPAGNAALIVHKWLITKARRTTKITKFFCTRALRVLRGASCLREVGDRVKPSD